MRLDVIGSCYWLKCKDISKMADVIKGTSRVKYRNSSQSSKSLKEWCCSWS